MINYIKGTVASVADTYIVLDCHDMGFQISMPSTDLFRITQGMEAVIYTHLAVREDDMSLYGFLGREEQEIFRQLLTVSGIGPRGALGILSSISAQELKMAIASGDAKLISSAKGIGLKTAQKLVVDLKGKFKNSVEQQQVSNIASASGESIETAVMFAVSTGLSRTQCMKALSKAQIPDGADVDQILDLIFKNISTV